jgi:hypothetical protein
MRIEGFANTFASAQLATSAHWRAPRCAEMRNRTADPLPVCAKTPFRLADECKSKVRDSPVP